MASVTDVLTSMQSMTAMETTRNIDNSMGKNDFLKLLAVQLRYQDPLEPVKDSDFAAQLAQFSALEQMENMNETLIAMANYQAYSLIGKNIYAIAEIDGVMTEVAGIVEYIFTDKGITYAQVGDYRVPVSTIKAVSDASDLPTPKLLIETSNNLIGRTVLAEIEEEDEETGLVNRVVIEGVVTRVAVDGGVMLAYIDDGGEEERVVPVGSIFSIRNNAASDAISSKTLLETSNYLIGRTVVAKTGDGEYAEGVVIRIVVDGNVMFAFVESSGGEVKMIPVDSIFDVRLTVPVEKKAEEPEGDEPKGDDPEDVEVEESRRRSDGGRGRPDGISRKPGGGTDEPDETPEVAEPLP